MRFLALIVLLVACSSSEPSPALRAEAHRLGFSSDTSVTTTLLSEPCAPGATITTGVNLPQGTTADPASVVLTDAAFGDFTLVGTTQVGTWFTVTTRNTSTDTERFSATLSYGVTP